MLCGVIRPSTNTPAMTPGEVLASDCKTYRGWWNKGGQYLPPAAQGPFQLGAKLERNPSGGSLASLQRGTLSLANVQLTNHSICCC